MSQPALNAVFEELRNEVQHSAYQERTKLRHISGENTKEAISCSIPTSIGSLLASHKSFFHDSFPTKELEKTLFPSQIVIFIKEQEPTGQSQ